MKTKIISKMPLSVGLVFVLASAITQLRGEASENPAPEQLPVVSIHSTGDVTRGKIGSFVLAMSQSAAITGVPYYHYVNFKVSGTAIPGVDYVALVSPANVGPYGYGVILVKTLVDPRGFSRQSYSVVVTLEPGVGYTLPSLAAARSAKITITP